MEVRITNCPSQGVASPCKIVRGTIVTMNMTFTHDEVVEAGHAVVIATAFGVTTEYPLPVEQADVCNRLIYGSCPLDLGESAIYSMEMPISEEYPITPLVLEISIENVKSDGNSVISCFSFNAETVLP